MAHPVEINPSSTPQGRWLHMSSECPARIKENGFKTAAAVALAILIPGAVIAVGACMMKVGGYTPLGRPTTLNLGGYLFVMLGLIGVAASIVGAGAYAHSLNWKRYDKREVVQKVVDELAEIPLHKLSSLRTTPLVENGIFLEADAQAIKELAHEYEQLLKTYREQNDPRSDACPFINTASDLKGRYDAMNASWLAYRAELVKRLPMQPTPKASGQ